MKVKNTFFAFAVLTIPAFIFGNIKLSNAGDTYNFENQHNKDTQQLNGRNGTQINNPQINPVTNKVNVEEQKNTFSRTSSFTDNSINTTGQKGNNYQGSIHNGDNHNGSKYVVYPPYYQPYH